MFENSNLKMFDLHQKAKYYVAICKINNFQTHIIILIYKEIRVVFLKNYRG